MSRWSSSYDPDRQRAAPRRSVTRRAVLRHTERQERRREHVLSVAEDAFAGVKITENTLIFKARTLEIATDWTIKKRVSAFQRQHRFAIVARGLTHSGHYVVTLASKTETAKFLLLWDDEEWVCLVPRAADGSRLAEPQPPA